LYRIKREEGREQIRKGQEGEEREERAEKG
jgi:hypothetical protein